MSKFLRLSLFIVFSGVSVIALSYFVISSLQETITIDDSIRAEAPGKFIMLKHGLVHYRLEGTDSGKLVLFIPGGGISGCEVFDKILPVFHKAGYRTLTYDLYGRGYSPRINVSNTPELFEEQLSELLNELDINESFPVITSSMGSMIGLDFTIHNLDKIEKVILIDPAITGKFKINSLMKIPVLSNLIMTFYWYWESVENQRREFVDQNVFNEYEKRLNYFMKFKGMKFTTYSTWSNMLNQNKLPLLGRIGKKDVLLLYGDFDPFFPNANVNQFKDVNPSIQVYPIGNAGHLPHLEKPLIVSNLIFTFLEN